MNTDLSVNEPNETPLQYYKRVRLVLEDRIEKLRAELRAANLRIDTFTGGSMHYRLYFDREVENDNGANFISPDSEDFSTIGEALAFIGERSWREYCLKPLATMFVAQRLVEVTENVVLPAGASEFVKAVEAGKFALEARLAPRISADAARAEAHERRMLEQLKRKYET
jgi:hypothetical protein